MREDTVGRRDQAPQEIIERIDFCKHEKRAYRDKPLRLIAGSPGDHGSSVIILIGRLSQCKGVKGEKVFVFKYEVR